MSAKSKLTIERLWAVFAEIEATEQLVQWQIGAIYLWPLIRASLMREVAEKLGVFEPRPPQPALVATDAKGLKQWVAELGETPYAVVPFVRRNAAGLDPFSTYLVDAIRDHGHTPLIFGLGPSDEGSGRPQVEHLERAFLKQFRNRAKLMVAPTLRVSHKAKYARVIDHIETQLAPFAEKAEVALASITGPYRRFPRWLLVEFYAQRLGWQRFFAAAGVRKIFMVNAWKRAMIAGAQMAGATVVEPMHGAISSIHPYLSWSGADWVAYQPDELLEWGPYWGDVAALPKTTVRKTIGAPEAMVAAFEREVELEAQDEAHLTNTVLIASQAHVTKKLTRFLLTAAAEHPNFIFTLKQHPQEAPVDFEAVARNGFRKGKVASAKVPGNLILAKPEANTLELMMRSEFVLGVYTTALFEAFALGCKVGVLDFSGWHHIRQLVDRGDAQLIEGQKGLAKFLKTAGTQNGLADRQRAGYYYAPPASDAELWHAIKIAE